MSLKLPDLIPVIDPKGGSPKTPPGGIPRSDYRRYMSHTERPDRDPGTGYVEIRDFFTLWLERLELFYNQRFADLESKTTLALSESDKAKTKAESATEKRFEGVNEFRATLADQAARLIPREEAQAKFDSLEKDIVSLDKAMQAMRERGSSITGRDLQRDQSRQDIAVRQSWFIPMLALGTIAVVNLLINLTWLLKK